MVIVHVTEIETNNFNEIAAILVREAEKDKAFSMRWLLFKSQK